MREGREPVIRVRWSENAFWQLYPVAMSRHVRGIEATWQRLTGGYEVPRPGSSAPRRWQPLSGPGVIDLPTWQRLAGSDPRWP